MSTNSRANRRRKARARKRLARWQSGSGWALVARSVMRWADERLRDPQELFIHGPEVVKITDAAGRVRLHRLQYGDGE